MRRGGDGRRDDHPPPKLPAPDSGTAGQAGQKPHGDQIKRATAFLPWLSGHGITLPACRQADIDAWHAGHNQHGRNTIRASCGAA